MDTRSTDALRERVARLEVLVGGPTSDGDGHTAFDKLQSLAEGLWDLNTRFTTWAESSQVRGETAEMGDLRAAVEEMHADVALLKQVWVARPQQGIADRVAEEAVPGRLKVPEPKKFEGTRSAKDLENFIWDMQEYFTAAKVPEDRQVSMASMFMTGDAKLWYRCRAEEDEAAGRHRIETWEFLKKELREQFFPTNTTWVASD